MPGSAAAMLRDVANNAKSFPRKFVEDAAKTVSKAVDKSLADDTGGDYVLSGTIGKRGPVKLGVKKKVTGDTIVTGLVSPKGSAGIWRWLEDGTGEPGPTAAKYTWTRAATPAVEALQRNARRRLGEIVRG